MGLTLYLNARLKGKDSTTDLLVENGIFTDIGNNLREIYPNIKCVDLGGKLTLPPYVESHIHLDYVYMLDDMQVSNEENTLFEGIKQWSVIKGNLKPETVIAKATQVIKKQVLSGVQFIRTHVDVGCPQKLVQIQS